MDYMDYTERTPSHWLRYVAITLTICITGVIISHFVENHTHAHAKKSATVLSLPPEKTTVVQNTSTAMQTITFTIKKHETLASLFHRAKLPDTLWMTVLKLPPAAKYLEQLQVGSDIDITTTSTNQFVSLKYSINHAQSLHVDRKGNYLVAKILQKPVTKTLGFKTSIIHYSLLQAEKNAGLSVNLQQELNAMFASGGIMHDIHKGDRLNVLYHQYFIGDQKDHLGNIVAAEIVDGKNHYRMVRFTENNHAGYYTPSGQGSQSLFLSSPLNYQRIGSGFSYGRFDPIAHRVQPHLGVDYDAPIGTPVKALGNGIIVFCKQIRGYGNVIMVRYNKTYKSFYAHLGRFASHLHAHEMVKKGQVIGYVGMTGWTTGPHLHFAVYKNGKAVNPLTLKFPHTAPIESRYRNYFFYKENHWFNEMKLFEDANDAAKK